jgi:hypothetical protein
MLLRAINEAIWLRDHASILGKEELFRIVEDIGEYGIFSARQISVFTGSRMSHQTVARLCNKTDKTGGRLAVKSLEDIKQCFFDRVNKKVNYKIVKRVLDAGTSQGMLEKLSGISQAKISKGIAKFDGSVQ